MSDSRVKRWARDRMAPETWDRAATGMARAGHGLAEAGAKAREWASIGSDHVTSMRNARIEPWRLVFAVFVIVVPAVLLSMPAHVVPAPARRVPCGRR